ncbi:uncharacterized protein BXZ73DRAFT_53810 [Epithele typhae]|uniref:uncharacterized protein n=1 Tax=Epithele typhae TaxID=378194 RepID=UPI0020084B78|nr:uncharacterized protein BXZ73DRAFT_53810 [Epithele typhae]KAH9916378.1 hypothetical protein BXZ73DRAFT_53810 [Epithele typhae]
MVQPVQDLPGLPHHHYCTTCGYLPHPSPLINEKPKPVRKDSEPHEKLAIVLNSILDDVHWSLGGFLHAVFSMFGRNAHRTQRHAQVVSRFLKGKDKDPNGTPESILDLWMRHSDGRSSSPRWPLPPKSETAADPVRVALMRFAVHLVEKTLVSEAEQAIKPQNGLHASRKLRKSDNPTDASEVQWADIGATTLASVSAITKTQQPLLWELLLSIAERAPGAKSVTDADDARRNRPAELVVCNVITTLDFSRSNRANLAPLSFGFLEFAFSTPSDIYPYQSRLGITPTYSTIRRTLEKMSLKEATRVRELGADPNNPICIITDNVQHYLKQRDACVGRANGINIGMAATYVELSHVPPSALDYDDKQSRVAANLRASVTVTQLLKFVDQEHFARVGVLTLLRILINRIPELKKYKTNVSTGYRTQAKKILLDPVASPLHPLGTSAKNETVTRELKDALEDFLGQVGQEKTSHHRKLVLCVGDGLTYDKIVQLKNYLRFHDNPFESFQLIKPVLAPWHTAWTDLSRIFSAHWDSLVSRDPSKLGFGAAKLHRRPPSNLKKPDFNQALEIVETVHDAHVLDCFR